MSVTDIGIQRNLHIMIGICFAALFQDLAVFLLAVFHVEINDQVKPDLRVVGIESVHLQDMQIMPENAPDLLLDFPA